MKPRQWHDLMIPLHDLVATMSGLEVEAAGTCLAERGTNLFRGNLGQSAVLEAEGKAAQWDPCPLVSSPKTTFCLIDHSGEGW